MNTIDHGSRLENEGSLTEQTSACGRTYDAVWPMLSVIIPFYSGGLQLSRCPGGLHLPIGPNSIERHNF
jgi:hypothetical protein